MKLFYSINSPYARKCRVVALEKSLQDRIEFIRADPWENPKELLAANPLGRIPALVMADGMALCESPVICEYLDTLAAPKLFPENMEERIEALRLAALADGIMDDAVAYVIETLKRPEEKRWPQWIKRKEDSIERTIAHIALQSWEGKPLSIGIIALAVALSYVSFRLPHLGWREAHASLSIWHQKFSTRPSMRATEPEA